MLKSRVLRIALSIVIGYAVYLVLALLGGLLGSVGAVELWIILALSCAGAFLGYRRLTRRALHE